MVNRRLCVLLVFALAACGSGPEGTQEPDPLRAPATGTPSTALPGTLILGDWTAYAAVSGDEWPVAQLDDPRWALVTAELACVGRARQGDPEAHVDGSRRVLAHHRTTGTAVMDYGIVVNADVVRATRLGELIAAAAENCS